MTEHDLFGEVPPAAKPAGKRKGPQARGYAAPVGSGPDGETCGTCKFCFKKTYVARPVFKCLLNRDNWSRTRRTDILFRAPACSKWEIKTDD